MLSFPYKYLPSPLSQSSSSATTASSIIQETQSIHPSLLRQAREKEMSIARTYALARTARTKLSTEASKHNHDLRLLVGHANLLDSLMIALNEAEKQQEEWFNETIRVNMADEEEYEEEREESDEGPPQQWLETDYESDTESEMSSEDEDEDEDEMEFEYEMPSPPTLPLSKPAETIFYQAVEVSEAPSRVDEEDSEVDEDGLYELTRTTSYRPPQLIEDISDEEDEDSNPPSPPQVLLHSFPKENKTSIHRSNFFGELPLPPRLPSKEPEEYFQSDYFRSAPMIDSY